MDYNLGSTYDEYGYDTATRAISENLQHDTIGTTAQMKCPSMLLDYIHYDNPIQKYLFLWFFSLTVVSIQGFRENFHSFWLKYFNLTLQKTKADSKKSTLKTSARKGTVA